MENLKKKGNKMQTDFRKVMVVDVEATCWEDKYKYTSDIIQIGVSLIDNKTLTIEKKDSIYVIPTQSTISRFCTDLTGITDTIIKQKGISFRDACNKLVADYGSKKYIWSAVGEYDRRIFEDQCLRENVSYPFSQKYFNMKTHIAMLNGWGKEQGMARMLSTFNLELEGTHHDGGDDAYNSSRILVKFLKQIRNK